MLSNGRQASSGKSLKVQVSRSHYATQGIKRPETKKRHRNLEDLCELLTSATRMLRYIVALCLLAVAWAQDCQVANIQVMQNFNRTRYAGTWYAVGKKDPEGLFLLDNIVANFEIKEDGSMTATARGRVIIFNHWEVCADMTATFQDTPDPAKFRMQYWGASALLQTGDDEHWVIATDYDNYAIQYSCRKTGWDGTCEDSYSFIFSRHINGLRREDQAMVIQKKIDICLLGKYRQVTHTPGKCESLTPVDTIQLDHVPGV